MESDWEETEAALEGHGLLRILGREEPRGCSVKFSSATDNLLESE